MQALSWGIRRGKWQEGFVGLRGVQVEFRVSSRNNRKGRVGGEGAGQPRLALREAPCPLCSGQPEFTPFASV